jgi:D-amino-acid dehydrogenase
MRWMQPERILVVGGGIAGLTLAWQLDRAGAEVEVLEAERVGRGASWGNAGWICPMQAGPLAEPGAPRYAVSSLLDRDAALHLAPAALPRLAPWLVDFGRACTPRRHAAGVDALGVLGARAFAALEALEADGVDLHVLRRGAILAAASRATVTATLRSFEPLRAHGLTVPDPEAILDADALHALEPTLSPHVGAGILISEHWQVHPGRLGAALAARLRERGVAIREETPVRRLSHQDGRVAGVETAGGRIDADAVVVATGAAAGRLLREAGVRLPVTAGKGYSATLPAAVEPRHPVLLLDSHVGVAPGHDGGSRVVGAMELSGVNRRFDPGRMAAVIRAVRANLAGAGFGAPRDEWVGMRPIAPDGLPVLDAVPGLDGAFVATGYSMLGMTVAAPAAELLGAFVLEGTRPTGLEPFRVDRFARRRATAARA